MTVIAALVDKETGISYIGGDRGASTPSSIHQMSEPKVWKYEDYLFGYYGVMSGEKIKFNFMPPAVGNNDLVTFMNSTFLQELNEVYERCHIDKHEDLELVVVVQGQIFVHNAEDMSMTPYAMNYIGEGSGGTYSMGAFYATEDIDISPEDRIRLALEAAVKYNPFCLDPIDILSNKDK